MTSACFELETARDAGWQPHVSPAFPADSRGIHDADPAREAARLGRELADADATTIIERAAARFGDGLVMSTSFGIQSAALLHLATRVVPDIPVVFVDTGYLPAETLDYARRLRDRLALNLRTARSAISPRQMEHLHGRLWESEDVASLDLYDQIRKVAPMRRALDDLDATAWLAGLRSEQTDIRTTLPRVGLQGGRFKVLPILDWSTRDVHAYLRANDLPLHPLFEQGYSTVGDWHSSRPAGPDDGHERETRFRGLKQECGLHLPDPGRAVPSYR